MREKANEKLTLTSVRRFKVPFMVPSRPFVNDQHKSSMSYTTNLRPQKSRKLQEEQGFQMQQLLR